MTAEIRNINRPLTEAIIIPANGIGVMSKGASSAILEVAGQEIEKEARALFRENKEPFEPGDCFATMPYKMARRGVKRVYHAVTIRYPGDVATFDSVNKSFTRALDKAIKDGVRTIAVPGLGTGAGRLDKSSVASLLIQIAQNVSDKIEVHFVDTNKEFVNELDKLLG